ncbi:MAG: J domain-containing protein [Proteobacteria bacterium]|nr:J domain-containing protein [Pseudomonadota bacterium]
MDYYAVLGVSPTASKSEIKKAYRDLAARYHPDHHQDNELKDLAEEKLAELNQAYQVLSDPARRAAYNVEQAGANHVPSTAPRTPSRGSGTPFTPRNILRLIAVLATAFYALRFIRSPRSIAVIGAVLFIVWFGPRVYRLLRRR